jgi:mannose-6-phosphate isomerase-like protein (cupin superfamily)
VDCREEGIYLADRMRFSLTILLLVSGPACGQLRDVVKSDQVDKMFAGAGSSLEVLAKPNFAIVFRVSSGKPGAWQKHPDADEFWFVRHGAAGVSLGSGDPSSAAGQQAYEVAEGDVVNVPRSTAYQITPRSSGFEYVAVRVFPVERRLGIGIGAAKEPHPMPAVGRKAQIDATLASADKNVLLHSGGVTLINHVVYKGAPGPWEVHQTCDDLYFMRLGTARAQLDGTLVNGKEDSPGEIRGTGVTGARGFNLGPGDMVIIPRNTAHFMDPGSNKLGYLLVKLCE